MANKSTTFKWISWQFETILYLFVCFGIHSVDPQNTRSVRSSLRSTSPKKKQKSNYFHRHDKKASLYIFGQSTQIIVDWIITNDLIK